MGRRGLQPPRATGQRPRSAGTPPVPGDDRPRGTGLRGPPPTVGQPGRGGQGQLPAGQCRRFTRRYPLLHLQLFGVRDPRCWRRGAPGASKTACTGCWTWPWTRITVECGGGLRRPSPGGDQAPGPWPLAPNLLKQERSAKVGVDAKRKKANWDFDYLLKVLFQ